jgi:type I restriction enzyme S subunit
LNEKIDLSHQINKTLEQISQFLFKHWVIDFEFPDENGNPYRSSGCRMNELKEIPEG